MSAQARIPRTARTDQHGPSRPSANPLLRATQLHAPTRSRHETLIHTIFEGTSEIQQLVIARAISGMRVE